MLKAADEALSLVEKDAGFRQAVSMLVELGWRRTRQPGRGTSRRRGRKRWDRL